MRYYTTSVCLSVCFIFCWWDIIPLVDRDSVAECELVGGLKHQQSGWYLRDCTILLLSVYDSFDKKVQQSWQTRVALAMHLPLARLVSMPVIFCLLPISSIVILLIPKDVCNATECIIAVQGQFRVIQGRWFWYQWKTCVRFSISDQ